MKTVLFPDAAGLLTGHLADQLAAEAEPVPVVTKIPKPRPEKFIRLRRTGGPRRDLVTDQPQVTIEAWAGTDEEAHDLAQLARAILSGLPGTTIDGVAVYRVDELGGPVDLPDPDSAQSRYTFTIQVALRGAAFEPAPGS